MIRANVVSGKVARDLKGQGGVHDEGCPCSITFSKFYLQ